MKMPFISRGEAQASVRPMIATLVPIEHIAGPYSNQRVFEWAMATAMLLVAFTLALPGDTMERAALRPMAAMGLTEDVLAVFFGVFGILRAGALAANGYLNNGYARPNGAWVRAVGCAAGAFIWGQLMIALMIDYVTSDQPATIVIPIVGTLCGYEIISCVRCRRDAIERARRSPAEQKIEKLTRDLVQKNGGL